MYGIGGWMGTASVPRIEADRPATGNQRYRGQSMLLNHSNGGPYFASPLLSFGY
jgi:hypothetical protein